ncbi:MAG: hypothetical protein V4492_08505, partial [Chlamydiota bacterium]
LFLLSTCALPLVHLPMQTLQEAMKSAWRIQMHHYADLAFAEIKEKVYTKQIDWDALSSPRANKNLILSDEVVYALPSTGKRTFCRKGFLHSVGKKTNEDKEFRLVTCTIEFQTKDRLRLFKLRKRKRDTVSYAYQFTVEKVKGISAPLADAVPPPLKDLKENSP